jgi:ankyrin repeat protein
LNLQKLVFGLIGIVILSGLFYCVDAFAEKPPSTTDKEAYFEAATFGDIESIKELLKVVPVDSPSDNGLSALFLASQMGHREIVRILIDSGAVVNRGCAHGMSALLQAAGFGHKDIVADLLDHDADPNIEDDSGYTPLMAACDSGRVEIVRRLLNAGAKTTIADDDKMTPLHFAARFGDIDVIKLLLDTRSIFNKVIGKNMDINALNKFGHTPLMLAYDRWNYPAVRLLVDQGADMDNYAFRIAAMNNDLKIANRLLEKGVDINAYGKSASRGGVPTIALLAAAMEGHEKMVEFLLAHHAKGAKGIKNLLGIFSMGASFAKSKPFVTQSDLDLLEIKHGTAARLKYFRIASKGEEKIITAFLDPEKEALYDRILDLLGNYSADN